ncbi:MAG: hypothetical protein LBE12_15870 [Planctomycetaceae bacterium]|jgi:hypothetical protein|nr:hypothetical protein [Planctomycetaceae bacterium]
MKRKYQTTYRRIHTTAEKRANCDPKIQYLVRGSRHAHQLPSTWNDIPSNRLCVKNWKEYREKTYHSNKQIK